MPVTFAKAKGPQRAPREAGGDDTVERDGNGRPRIRVSCDRCTGDGRQPSDKRPGKTVQCARCKGVGERLVSYTRVTTFIDALDDKSMLGNWKARMVLIGAAMDTGFLDNVLSMDPEDPEDKQALNARAEAAADLAGASAKADKGTELHGYSEDIDNGVPLPDDISALDWLVVQSYADATQHILEIRHMERLVVNDVFGAAGTPDRVSTPRPGVTLVAPDGTEITYGELLITDLKTGRIDYGALKIAQQLAMYAKSKLYNKDAEKIEATREDLGNINQKWGIIMHSPAGSGETTLYWADLTLGWRAVGVAWRVRKLRSLNSKALIQFAPDGTSTFFAKAS